MIIRVCTQEDYAAVVEIHNLVHPERAVTGDALGEGDRMRDPKCRHQRWVALQGGRIVGFGVYSQHVYEYHPNKFHVDLAVLPDYRRRGIGSALYDQLAAGLAPFEPQKLRADGYENLPDGVRFLQHRGFQEVFRETPLYLEVSAFDPGPYAGLEGALRDQGIEIQTLRDLERDPDRDRKVYDLTWEMEADVPREDEPHPMAFDVWAKWTMKNPLVPHEGYMIAVCGDEYVGMAEFGQSSGDEALHGGLVGVKRAFRRKGVALAMHVRAIAYARTQRYARILTSTAIVNVGMRALYARLGFVRGPDWIQMEKVCDGT